jgi:uncharacterized cofD-like protein
MIFSPFLQPFLFLRILCYDNGMPISSSKKRIVIIGGGTGTSTILKGLRKYPVLLSVIVTTADDGGSSGRLREDFTMPPPGDARQCLVALAGQDHPVVSFFNHRFEKGELRGHSFGNIFLALLYQKTKDFQATIRTAQKMFKIPGEVIPVTATPTTLCASLKDGRVLKGEGVITASQDIVSSLDYLWLQERNAKANASAIRALENANAILVGPGNLFSSIVPNFLVKGISEVFLKSKAKKIYIANLLTQIGHTDNFALEDFLAVLARYIKEDAFDHVVYNTEPITKEFCVRAGVKGEEVKPRSARGRRGRYVGARLLNKELMPQDAADPLARTPIRHDPDKLAKVIMRIVSR